VGAAEYESRQRACIGICIHYMFPVGSVPGNAKLISADGGGASDALKRARRDGIVRESRKRIARVIQEPGPDMYRFKATRVSP